MLITLLEPLVYDGCPENYTIPDHTLSLSLLFMLGSKPSERL